MASSKKRPERTPKFADYLRLFSYATTWDWCVYAAAAIASLGAGVTMPLMNILFGQLVGQFTGYFSSPTDTNDEDFYRLLDRQSLYIMALFLGRWALNTINKFCFRMIGIRISSAVRLHYLRSLFAQSVHVIDSMPPGAAATTITATANTLQLGVSEHLGTLLQHNGTIWSAFIIAFIWNWRLTLVTSSLIVYLFLLIAILTPLVMKWQAKSLAADARGTTIASEALGGIRSVMAFGAQDRVMSRYETEVNEAMRRGLRIAPAFGLHVGLTFFGVYGAYILAFWYGSELYIGGTIPDAGTVIVVLMSVMMGMMSIERVSTPIMAVNKATVAACEFFTVIDAPPPPSGDRKVDSIASQDVVFDGVTFEYPGRLGVKVLDELSFRVRAGKTTALVGASGSGKSTVVALMERWYSLKEPHVLPGVKVQQEVSDKDGQVEGADIEGAEVEGAEIEATEEDVKSYLAGSITVDGINLEQLDLTWWRAQIGLVQQEPFLYNDTIANNVAHGLIGTEWADVPAEQKLKLVQEACREAYADEFINRLPDGYDTHVGDGGIKLSGGQKQRIAIARSIIKRPQIIILDEATSAIDATSEKLVQAALDNATRGRTTITIAHRLSTIKQADHIVVLQNGRAVEQGTHQSLLGNEAGLYSALVRAQALRFSDDDAGSALEVKHEPEPQSQVTNTNGQEPSLTEAKTRGQELEHAHIQQSRSFANSFLRLLYEQQARWPTYASILVCAMAVAACTPLLAYLFAKLIAVFLIDPESSSPSLASRASFWCLMWLALACGYGLSWFATASLATRTQYRVSAAYKLRYLGDMIRQPLAFFDRPGNAHGSLTARVAGDAKMLEELLGMNLASSLTGAFIVVGCVAIAVAHAWRLGLVATFVTMPVMVASGLWKYRQEVQFDQMNAAVFAESAQFATEAIEAMRTVSSLTMESAINERYSRLLDGHVQRALVKARWTAALFGFADSAGLGCQALVFWYGGRLMVSGEYGLEAFFVCFMAIIYGAESASQVLSVVPNAAQASGAANRILDLQESVRAYQALNDANAHNKVPGGEGEDGMDIELRHVQFAYPTREIPVLKDLSVHIPKGHFAAFVGPSGCGKTTIISLLERFYDVGGGAILCDGIDVSSLDAHLYRQRLALVAQEPILFRGTLRDNILFGVPDPTIISEDAIHQACRDAFIHDFIVSLPEGYDTDVGHRGVSMSGGQKQRIALARALVREPKVLLLDEATSALDSESERYVQAALETVRGRRTVIAVAHRLSTVQNADVIFFVEDGTVLEKGTHDELVRRRGAYWTFCQSQALDV